MKYPFVSFCLNIKLSKVYLICIINSRLFYSFVSYNYELKLKLHIIMSEGPEGRSFALA